MESSPVRSLPSRWLRVAAGAQLALTHAVAAMLVWRLVLVRPDLTLGRVGLAMLFAALVGIVLTVNLQSAITAVYAAVMRLNSGLSVPPLRAWRIDPLSPVIAQVNRLARRDVGSLRETLLAQTREAAIQEERNRLARELHDSIKQQVFSIGVSAAAVDVQWERDPAAAQAALADARQSVREVMVEMNALLQHLSPAPLEKVGLIQALREQMEALGYRTGAQVQVEIGDLPEDERLPTGAQEAIFRIAQEALSNVARHARAQSVTLRLHEQADQIHLYIEDDGQGFDAGHVAGGMGLGNIRGRAGALEGRVAIASAPGSGTGLHVTIPLIDANVLQEEAMNKINHFYNKLFLAGAAGGLVVTAALYIPLYVLLPGQYIDDWMQVPALLGPLCWLAAAGLLVGTGYLAARWVKAGSRWQASLIGALAGSVAVLIAFVGLGAGAAGVLGARPILDWGYRPANDHLHLMQIGVDSLLGMMVWNYRVLWASILAGVGLGALGGMVFGPVENQPDNDNLLRGARLLLNLALVGASTALTIHIPMLTRAEPVVRQVWQIVVDAPDRPLNFEPAVVTLWPIGSSLAAFVLALGARYVIQWADARSEDAGRLVIARTSGVMLAAWTPIMALFLLWLTPEMISSLTLRPLLLAGAAVGAVLSLLYALDVLRAGRRLDERGMARPLSWQIGGAALAVLILAAFTMLFLLPGLNGMARSTSLGIYHSAWLQLDLTKPLERFPYFLPLGVTPFGPGDNAFAYYFSWFDQYGALKTVTGLAGGVLSYWLLKKSAVWKATEALSLQWGQLVRTAAGSLLGMILIISFATTLPGTAATSMMTVLFSSTGFEMFRERGGLPDIQMYGDYAPPLWPLSYYGEDVAEPPQRALPSDEELARWAQQAGQTVAEVRAQILARYEREGQERGLLYRLRGSYRQQYFQSVAYPIIMLILSGLVWLVVMGIDFLAWRRARVLAQQLGEQEQPASS
ncbi:MAG: sensor histidine kinase [Anaerolineae bacterium]|nr:sensor histidine kinase [Anaerolineae bacterium]